MFEMEISGEDLRTLEILANKTVAIYEWKYQTEDFGPPLEHRLKPEFMQELSEQAGFAKMEIVPLKNLVLYKFFK